jgi:diaminopimelate dehydrogenase
MPKIKVAIVGFGNLGRGVVGSLKDNPDLELAQIISRDPARVKKEVQNVPVFGMDNFKKISDIAILCGGSKEDLFGIKTNRKYTAPKARIPDPRTTGQGPYFAQFFNTVDSFDTHARIPDYHQRMDKFSRTSKHTAIISAGWDPGTFSLERILADAFIPGAKHYTFWGPGVSQGHSDAVRRIPGVRDCRQYTLPVKSAVARVRTGKNPVLSLRQKHTRLVYVVPEPGADRPRITRAIKTMPNYFEGYDTKVVFMSPGQLRKEHGSFPHAGFVLASGKTGTSNKAMIDYHCAWGSNPEATANILVACCRACYRLNRERRYGAFTMPDIPPAYLSPRSKKELLENFM